MTWGLILLTVFASSAGDILCAKGMSAAGEMPHFGPWGVMRALRYILRRKLVIVGGALYATAFLSLLALLSVAQLSAAVPATALSFVVDTLGARFILHEHVPWKRWAGVMCVTAGVILAVKSGPAQVPNSVLPTQSSSPAGLQGSGRTQPEPSRGL
ncbi:MAG: hypothetical protein WBW84_09005 [Acidobacteriaceae bacterium]